MIRFAAASKSYRVDGTPIPALHPVDLEITKGEVFGIIGHSGAGKSTMLRLINLLERPTSGQVLIDGRDVTHAEGAELRRLRAGIGMIFQHFNLLSGRIDRIKDTPYGQLTLAMNGERLEDALIQIRSAGVDIEEVAR